MTPLAHHTSRLRVRTVRSFEELLSTRFADGVNALRWPRVLDGDFAEVALRQGGADAIETLDETALRSLSLSLAGQTAVEALLSDLHQLRAHGLDPALNCVNGYLRDAGPNALRTDVYSFHVDKAPVETDTWLCTYYGAPSEGIDNDDAVRRVDVPELRALLLGIYGGTEGDGFREFLAEEFHDLHYVPKPYAQPFSFGVGTLWRVATQWPGSPVPPCVHRAPTTVEGARRLLLIS
ncbi:MAG: hypothetical protein RJA70_1441 [Pseudomonadota bacterium]|jgi:hypothetical protein